MPRRCLCQDFERRASGPEIDSIVYLHRTDGNDVKISGKAKSKKKSDNVKLVVSWIKAALFTIDIALFSILHKKIVKSLAQCCTQRNIRCRVILYRSILYTSKRAKLLEYIARLKSAGVKVRWVDGFTNPTPEHRIAMIDCTDPLGRSGEVDSCFIYGDEFTYPHHFDIARDLAGLVVMKDPPNDFCPWVAEFKNMWHAKNSQIEFPPDEGPEALRRNIEEVPPDDEDRPQHNLPSVEPEPPLNKPKLQPYVPSRNEIKDELYPHFFNQPQHIKRKLRLYRRKKVIAELRLPSIPEHRRLQSDKPKPSFKSIYDDPQPGSSHGPSTLL